MATFKTYRLAKEGTAQILVPIGNTFIWSNYPIFLGNSDVKGAPTDRVLLNDKLQLSLNEETILTAYSINHYDTEVYTVSY